MKLMGWRVYPVERQLPDWTGNMRPRGFLFLPFGFAFICLLFPGWPVDQARGQSSGSQAAAVRASSLLDISGIEWLDDDVFVAVHDGKNDELERDWPRVSLVLLPADVSTPPEFARAAAGGIYYQNLEVAWPSGTPNDLESIARIPDPERRQFLLAESGDDCSGFQRIFLATLDTSYRLTIDEVAQWPSTGLADCNGVFNVEGTAVFRLGADLYFVFAERAEGLPYTDIHWSKMRLDPLSFGPLSSFRYRAGVTGPGIRPIVALEVDARGFVYAAAAYDSGEDNGPFRSFVSMIGQFRRNHDGRPRLVPSGRFAEVARQDGYKIEGLALRARSDGRTELYAGTDDENYGATLRLVAPVGPNPVNTPGPLKR